VPSALTAGQQQKLLALRAYVLVANQVHVLIGLLSSITQITQQINGARAREANLILGCIGSRFWQCESFDHWIRDAGEWQRVRSYIERNPIAAGLVGKPEDWPWSSASRAGE
jgi:putative transposase